MPRAASVRVVLLVLAAVAWLAHAASIGLAQTTGMVRGKVVDVQGAPIEAATVVIEYLEGITRKHEIKTNKKGEFIQIGVSPGRYKVTASKERFSPQVAETRVRVGEPAELNFVLGAPTGPEADPARAAALKKLFEEGVALSRAGSYDEAIAKFEQAAQIVSICFDCYYNIGYAHLQKKSYAEAEAAFKKAIELKGDYADAYNALASVYNAQRRFEAAAEASAKATQIGGTAAGGNPDAVYNQGVILWNAGKIAEARKQFEEALRLNPNYANAHYWLGMANLNEGKIAEATGEFEAYLKLAPDGEYAAQAKAILDQIKKPA